MDTATKSAIFTTYNKARKAARQGKIDGKRLNRALGILLSKSYPHQYNTTIRTCDCPDSRRHPQIVCKHRLAKMVLYRINEAAPVAA